MLRGDTLFLCLWALVLVEGAAAQGGPPANTTANFTANATGNTGSGDDPMAGDDTTTGSQPVSASATPIETATTTLAPTTTGTATATATTTTATATTTTATATTTTATATTTTATATSTTKTATATATSTTTATLTTTLTSTITTTTATQTSTSTSTATEKLAADPGEGNRVVRILHLSDTHNMHRDIERQFPMPEADILLHTGDVSTWGTDKEFDDVNQWFGELKERYAHILVITGNHDWVETLRQVEQGRLSPKQVLDPSFLQAKLSNARLLNNEMVTVKNLKIYGCAWSPWYGNMHIGDGHEAGWYEGARANILSAWGSNGNLETAFPRWMDILMTHNPPRGYFDEVGSGVQWGSSEGLTEAIIEQTPKVHLFGHVHEQRGLWQRMPDGTFRGGVEYQAVPGTPYLQKSPPPANYPVQVISNNAMLNQPGVEFAMTGKGKDYYHIVAPARLITATWVAGRWHFVAEQVHV